MSQNFIKTVILESIYEWYQNLPHALLFTDRSIRVY